MPSTSDGVWNLLEKYRRYVWDVIPLSYCVGNSGVGLLVGVLTLSRDVDMCEMELQILIHKSFNLPLSIQAFSSEAKQLVARIDFG